METPHHTESSKVPVRFGAERRPSGPRPGFAMNARQTSEHKETAARGGEAVDKIIEVISRSPLALGVFESASDELYAGNSALHKLLEIDEAPGTPCHLSEALPPDCIAQLVEIVRHVEQTRDSVVGREVKFCRPSTDDRGQFSEDLVHSSAVWRVSAWPTVANSERRRFVIVQVDDLTEEHNARMDRAKMVAELQEVNARLVMATLREEDLKVRAESAATAKANFLATMSHELRTPLAAIIGYEELLAGQISGPVTDLQSQQLGRIKASALHLLDLINEVLTLARAEAGEETVDRSSFLLEDLVTSALSLVEPLAHSKGLEFDVRMQGGSTVLETDELKLRQILVNLLGNAVKFTDSGGVSLSVDIVDNVVFYSIKDSGIGVAPEHSERIFDSFWQIHQSASRRVGGSGVGLSVSRRLARLLGGDVVVQSELGSGSTFTLSAPLEAPHSPSRVLPRALLDEEMDD